MQIKQIVFLALAGVVIADGHKNEQGNENGTMTGSMMGMGGGGKGKNGTRSGNSDKRECGEIARLTEMMDLVNNATRLAAFETKHKLNQTQIDELKTKTTAEQTKLQPLTSNSTLMTECAVIGADRKLQFQCHQIKSLTKLSAIANNATAMQEFETKHKMSAEQMTRFMDEAKNASGKLTKLQSNATLVTACQAMKDGKGGKFTSFPISAISTNKHQAASAGGISENAKSGAARSIQLVGTTAFVAVLGSLLAGLLF